MPPLYRFRDQEAKPCLWLHHHCAEICFKPAVRGCDETLESQVHSLAETQGRAAAMTRTDLTLPKQVRGHQAAAAVRCGRLPCQAANTRDIGLGTGRPFRVRKSIIGRSTVRTAGR